MAQFRATIQGQRGQASRLGSAKSGISATVNGWEGGVTVEAVVNHDGVDCFNIFKTGGSNGSGSVFLGCVVSSPKGSTWTEA